MADVVLTKVYSFGLTTAYCSNRYRRSKVVDYVKAGTPRLGAVPARHGELTEQSVKSEQVVAFA